MCPPTYIFYWHPCCIFVAKGTSPGGVDVTRLQGWTRTPMGSDWPLKTSSFAYKTFGWLQHYSIDKGDYLVIQTSRKKNGAHSSLLPCYPEMALRKLSVLSCLYSRLVLGSPLTESWRPTQTYKLQSIRSYAGLTWPSIPDSPGLPLLVPVPETTLLSLRYYPLLNFSIWSNFTLGCVHISFGFCPLHWQAFKSESCYALPSAVQSLGRFEVLLTMYWFCLQRPLLSTPLVKRLSFHLDE